MDCRQRRLAVEVRYLKHALKNMSAELLIIQDFIQHTFGPQLTAYLKIGKRDRNVSLPQLPSEVTIPSMSSNFEKRRGRGVASGGVSIPKAKAISNSRKRKGRKPTRGNKAVKRKKSNNEDEPTVVNDLSESDEEIDSPGNSPTDGDAGKDVSSTSCIEQTEQKLDDDNDQAELNPPSQDDADDGGDNGDQDSNHPIDEQQPETPSGFSAVEIKVEASDIEDEDEINEEEICDNEDENPGEFSELDEADIIKIVEHYTTQDAFRKQWEFPSRENVAKIKAIIKRSDKGKLTNKHTANRIRKKYKLVKSKGVEWIMQQKDRVLTQDLFPEEFIKAHNGAGHPGRAATIKTMKEDWKYIPHPLVFACIEQCPHPKCFARNSKNVIKEESIEEEPSDDSSADNLGNLLNSIGVNCNDI